MSWLEFSRVHSYSSRVEGISVPVVMRSGGNVVDLLARVDTGASNCLFAREQAEMLGLKVEAGDPKTFWTAAGRVKAFGHLVSMEVLDIELESIVYFFADEGIKRNLLGRTGWLDRLRFGLVDRDQLLYLAEYDVSAQGH